MTSEQLEQNASPEPVLDRGDGVPDRVLAALCWSTAATLLGFQLYTQLGVLIAFSAGWSISRFLAPAALVAALGTGDWLARREGMRGRPRMAPPAAASGILGVSLLLSAAFFDMSWDGLIAVVLLGVALIRPGLPREVVILLVGAVVASLVVGIRMWWARYGPQLWWLPIIAVIAGLAVPGWRAVRWAAWSLATLLLVNAALVGVAHFRWELQSTRTTREQLAFLRQKGEVEVDLQYFVEPFGERLRAGGVTFRPSRKLHCDHPMELMSVARGYPGQIRACVPAK